MTTTWDREHQLRHAKRGLIIPQVISYLKSLPPDALSYDGPILALEADADQCQKYSIYYGEICSTGHDLWMEFRHRTYESGTATFTPIFRTDMARSKEIATAKLEADHGIRYSWFAEKVLRADSLKDLSLTNKRRVMIAYCFRRICPSIIPLVEGLHVKWKQVVSSQGPMFLEFAPGEAAIPSKRTLSDTEDNYPQTKLRHPPTAASRYPAEAQAVAVDLGTVETAPDLHEMTRAANGSSVRHGDENEVIKSLRGLVVPEHPSNAEKGLQHSHIGIRLPPTIRNFSAANSTSRQPDKEVETRMGPPAPRESSGHDQASEISGFEKAMKQRINALREVNIADAKVTELSRQCKETHAQCSELIAQINQNAAQLDERKARLESLKRQLTEAQQRCRLTRENLTRVVGGVETVVMDAQSQIENQRQRAEHGSHTLRAKGW